MSELLSPSASVSAVHIVTNRFGDLFNLDQPAAALLNIAARRTRTLNLLHFFIDGRLELAGDLRTVTSVESPTRAATLRPKERAARRVAVTICDVADGVRWTVHDLGLATLRTQVAPETRAR